MTPRRLVSFPGLSWTILERLTLAEAERLRRVRVESCSAAGTGGYGPRGLPAFGLSEREQQEIWEHYAASQIQRAPPGDKPVLTLESMDIVTYGANRLLRVRFRSDERRGSMHWTVLGLYTDVDTILLAHLGTPENREEGIAGLESIATTLRRN